MAPTLERTTTPLASGLAFGEGPRWHGGRLWLSDMHGRQVVTVDPAGRLETVVRVEARPSGLGWLPDGRLLVVSMEDRKLLRLAGGALETHADLSALASHEINDLVVASDGCAYVSQFGFAFGKRRRVPQDRDPARDTRTARRASRRRISPFRTAW